MKNWILISVLFISCLHLQAAESVSYTLSGKVTDISGEPVSFATLSFNDAEFAATSDVDGLFEIKLEKEKYSCKVSAISYRTYGFYNRSDKGHGLQY